jgi:hypothetical protein
MRRMASAFSRRYDSFLKSHRLATTTASGATLALLGDSIAQATTQATRAGQNEPGLASFDARRSCSFAIFGGIVTGPMNFLWLNALERWTARLAPSGGTRALVTKVLLQSSVLQPMIYLPTFFTVTAIVRRWSPEEALCRVRQEYAPTLTRLWAFWTPSVIFAFKLLPVRQQSIFFAGIGFAWNVLLSCFSNPSAPRLTMPRP